ncbi:MAG: hypothetical protein M1832_005483 [Thelocarpon impressellum]|nr:MAG: hypothetical protein M1832_005483 [Thelocarpon impressellum]
MVRPRDFSQQSAPAAPSMARADSCFSSNSEHLPANTESIRNPALYTGLSSTDITAWQTEDPPFNAYTVRSAPSPRRLTSQRPALPQVVEVDTGFGKNPADWLSSLEESPIGPRSGPMVPSASARGLDRFSNQAQRSSIPDLAAPSGFSTQWPSSQSAAGLTTGNTAASDNMSRQPSLVSSALCGGLDMLRFSSIGDLSNPDYNEEFSPVQDTSSFPVADEAVDGSFDKKNISHVLRGAGAFSDPFHCAPSTAAPASFQPSSVAEDMERQGSNDSAGSSSSAMSARKRRQEHLANARRPIAPKTSDDEDARSSRKSQRWGVRGGPAKKEKMAIAKSAYKRPEQQRVYCTKCTVQPLGFRGTNELKRHFDSNHGPTKTMWVCVDAPRLSATECKVCASGKKYNKDYNAAAHLRRTHFNKTKKGGRPKNEKAGGSSGGKEPPMEELRVYLKEVTVPRVEVDGGAVDDEDDEDAIMAVEEQIDLDLDLQLDFGTSASYDPTASPDSDMDILPDADVSTEFFGSALPTQFFYNDNTTTAAASTFERAFDVNQDVPGSSDFLESSAFLPESYPMNDATASFIGAQQQSEQVFPPFDFNAQH